MLQSAQRHNLSLERSEPGNVLCWFTSYCQQLYIIVCQYSISWPLRIRISSVNSSHANKALLQVGLIFYSWIILWTLSLIYPRLKHTWPTDVLQMSFWESVKFEHKLSHRAVKRQSDISCDGTLHKRGAPSCFAFLTTCCMQGSVLLDMECMWSEIPSTTRTTSFWLPVTTCICL